MNRLLSCILFLAITFSSCQINGSFRGLYGYQHSVVKELNDKAVYYSEANNDHIDKNKIQIINGKDLNNYMIKFRKSYIYIWKPNCKSKLCIDLDILQQTFNEKDAELIIVAEYYDYDKMNLSYKLNHPIFGIDCDFYNSNLTNRYLEKFINDVSEMKAINYSNSFYEFKDGSFLRGFYSIVELDKGIADENIKRATQNE